MKTQIYSVTGVVKVFNMEQGWHYIVLPKEHPALKLPRSSWGFVPITATVGETSWRTSLMPMGKHSRDNLFIALPAKARKREGIMEGDRVTITFTKR